MIVDLCDRAPDGASEVRIADDRIVLPGLVDSHVHVNEPGRTEWEGFATATAAAAAGRVTTIVDMPLNSIPPTVDVAALGIKRAATEGKLAIDVASGAVRCRATPRSCAGCTKPASSGSSASWCPRE